VEAKNAVVLLAKTTTITRPTVCRRKGVKLMPHVSQLTVEGIDKGVLLSNGASKLQDGDVKSVALRLVELCRTLPHLSSGRQGGEIHSKLNLHTAKEDLSSMSLINLPILIVAQIEHVLLTGLSMGHLCLIRRWSTVCPSSRLVRTNRDRRVRSAASEMSPQPLTVKAHMKHREPLPKVAAIKGNIQERHSRRRTSSSHSFFLAPGCVGSAQTVKAFLGILARFRQSKL
jgi:hypothetical protein